MPLISCGRSFSILVAPFTQDLRIFDVTLELWWWYIVLLLPSQGEKSLTHSRTGGDPGCQASYLRVTAQSPICGRVTCETARL